MKKFTLSLLLVFVLGITSAMAQSRTISGEITDSVTGESITGATILVQGTANGAYSLADGKFAISNVDGLVNLEITFMGYVDKIISVSDSQTKVDVQLTPSAMQMDEIVVVAYGTADKKSLTGSVAVISSKKFEQRPITNIASAIAGMTPGVVSTVASGQPGAEPDIQIRGVGSINSNKDPLYVLDGIPFTGTISSISTTDIASITILKDAASTALYGSRASNGVIMIQTKSGRVQKMTFDVKVTQGFSYRAVNEYEKVNAEDWYGMAWESLRNMQHFTNKLPMDEAGELASSRAFGNLKWYNILGDKTTGKQMANDKVFQPQSWDGYEDQNWTRGAIHSDASILAGYQDDMDWIDAMSNMGYRQEYIVNASGGTEKSSYYMSVGYLNDDGYFDYTSMNRMNIRAKVDVTPTKWLKVGANTSLSTTRKDNPYYSNSGSYDNPWRYARELAPVYPVNLHNMNTGEYILDDNGNKILDMGTGYKDPISGEILTSTRGQEIGRNPLYMGQKDVVGNDSYALDAVLYAQITFLNDFKLSIDASQNLDLYLYESYRNPTYGTGAPSGSSQKQVDKTINLYFKQMLNWDRSFEKHSIGVLLGHEYYDKSYDYLSASKTGVIFEGSTELDNFSNNNQIRGYSSDYLSEAIFAGANYNYDEKYYLSGSFRRDGSSKFSPENRWGSFWSVGASWIISSEEFMSNIMWVDFLKFRASYGTNGNDGGYWNRYQWQSLYSTASYNGESALRLSTIGTPNLKWESLNGLDIGVDFRLFNKLNSTINYYEKSSDGLVFNVPVSESSGITTIKRNVGSMINRGIEFSFDVDAVRNQNWVWNIGLNFAWMQNRVIELPGANADGIVSGDKKMMAGHSMYEFYVAQFAGIDSQDGGTYYHVDPEKRSSSDFQLGNSEDWYTKIHGNAKKDFSGDGLSPIVGSMTSSLSWKNFNLSALISYKIGGKSYDYAHAGMMEASYNSAWSADMYNSWRKPGDVTGLPRMNANNSNLYKISTRNLINNSAIALQNLTLTYQFPKNIVNKLSLGALSVYASGENLFQLSTLQGYDAMASMTGSVSNSRFGSMAVISFGVNISF